MSLKEVHGDVVAVARKVAKQASCEVLLPHVCNNAGVMGAGVARAIAVAWPGVDIEYAKICRDRDGAVLGRVVTEHAEPHVWVMNMIAQDGFFDGSGTPLRYGALVHCMEAVCNLAASHTDMGVKSAVVCPKFGAGLARGNWDIIRGLIVELWVERGLSVVIVNYP